MIKKLFLIILFCICNLVKAQEEVPFTVRFQDYIQGDLTFIANNIVNRNDRKNANESFNKTTIHSKLNDEYEMSYIDVDKDKTTYSSSSATFVAKKNAKELIFAGLYWGATYKYGIGFNDNEVYSGDGERMPNIDEIKIKTPSQSSYQNIKGQIIFDGYQNKKHKNNAPYVCFYDLTDMVEANPYGEYTVANIKSTQGFIEGGVSGGWIIYFVYNDGDAVKKYITLYDGFAYVYNKPIEIKLSNFLTPKEGEINSRIALAALEGDLKIEGDNVRLKNLSNKRYFPVLSKSREPNNFFNSSITIEEEQFINRNPASLNTLGFDALILSLDNKKNKVIENNATQTELKFASAGDKVYLFSAGFSIDVDQDFYEKNKRKPFAKKDAAIATIEKEVTDTSTNTPKKANSIIKNKKDIKPIPKKIENIIVEESNKKNKVKNTTLEVKAVPKPNIIKEEELDIEEIYEDKPVQFTKKEYNPSENLTTNIRKKKEIRKLGVPVSLKAGYYIVSNVFAIEDNAKKYIKFLKQNKIKSISFVNPENNYQYVYLKFYKTIEEAQKAYDTNLDETFFEDYWILEVEK
jgi:hypothetical protein